MRSNVMSYEKTPVMGGKRLNRVSDKFVAKSVKDINKLSTGRILAHVYHRHEILILQLACALVFIYAIVSKF